MSFSHKGTGFVLPSRWPTIDEIAAHSLRMGAARGVGSFAPTVLGVPTTKDQGGSNACLGFTIAQGVHIVRQALGMDSEFPSPTIPYWEARRLQVATDAEVADIGSDPDAMITAVQDFGVCSWDSLPFEVSAVNERPGPLAMLDAQKLRCYLQPIFATGASLWLAIQHAISVERLPVAIAIEVVPAFDNPRDGIVDDPSGTSRGLHAQCLYGIEPRGALDANSWGTGWGLNGNAILTPRFLGSRVRWAASLNLEAAS